MVAKPMGTEETGGCEGVCPIGGGAFIEAEVGALAKSPHSSSSCTGADMSSKSICFGSGLGGEALAVTALSVVARE